MGAQGNYSDQWDDSDSGGQPCACGRHCAEADNAGNAQVGPRAFCATDTHHIGAVIRGLPGMYTDLSLKLAKEGQREERVSGSRDAPVPVDLEVQAFMRHLVLCALTWEELVRQAADLSNPDLCPSCRGEGSIQGRGCRTCQGDGVIRARDGAALQRACVLLGGRDHERTGYLGTLLGLEPAPVTRPVPGSTRLSELEPGSAIRIDSAGDAWERKDRGGADAGLEFLKLNGRARGILGLTLESRRVAARCECESIGTIKQRQAISGGWEAVARCSACGRAYIGAEFEDLMGREFEATQNAGRAS